MLPDCYQPETLSFAEALDGIRSDWQRYVPRIQKDRTKLVLRGLWERIGTGFALAEILQAHPAEWDAFARLPFWAERDVALKQDHVLRYAMQFVLGHAVGSRAERAASFANALYECFWGSNPLSAEEIPDYIEQSGGIENLLIEYRARKIAAPEQIKTLSLADSNEGSDDPFDDDFSDDEGQFESRDAARPSAAVVRPSKARIARYPDGIRGLERLEVLIDASAFAGIIKLEDGAETTIRIRVVPNGSSAYRRIEALPDDEG